MGWLRSAIAATVVTLLVAGCGGSDSSTTRSAESVETVLAKSGAAMADVTSLQFTIDHEGANVFIGGGGAKVAFESAKGRYAAPASADAVIAVSAGSLRTEVGAVAIDGSIWITDPISGRWVTAPDAFRFDPSRIFQADVGLSSLLTEGLSDAKLESEKPDSDGRYYVTARVSAEQVSTLTSGLVTDVRDTELWIDADTYLLTKMTFTVPLDSGDTRWTLELSEYGSPVTIDEPQVG